MNNFVYKGDNIFKTKCGSLTYDSDFRYVYSRDGFSGFYSASVDIDKIWGKELLAKNPQINTKLYCILHGITN